MNSQPDIFADTLRQLLSDMDAEVAVLPNLGKGHKGPLVRLLMPISQTDDTTALTDVAWGDFTEKQDLLHFHTTVLENLGDGAAPLLAEVIKWNESVPLGFFNVTEEGSFVHRYTLPFPADIQGEELAQQTMDLLQIFSGMISKYYPEAARIAGK